MSRYLYVTLLSILYLQPLNIPPTRLSNLKPSRHGPLGGPVDAGGADEGTRDANAAIGTSSWQRDSGRVQNEGTEAVGIDWFVCLL